MDMSFCRVSVHDINNGLGKGMEADFRKYSLYWLVLRESKLRSHSTSYS